MFHSRINRIINIIIILFTYYSGFITTKNYLFYPLPRSQGPLLPVPSWKQGCASPTANKADAILVPRVSRETSDPGKVRFEVRKYRTSG